MFKFLIQSGILSLMLLFYSTIQAADAGHSHQHYKSPHEQRLELNNGKKWETDLPLRTSMTNIANLVKESLPAVHNGEMSDENYKVLGQKLNDETNAIFKNCKLSPKADQMLHIIIVKIFKAQQAFLGKNQKSNKHDIFVDMLMTLQDYPKYFEHPGWVGL